MRRVPGVHKSTSYLWLRDFGYASFQEQHEQLQAQNGTDDVFIPHSFRYTAVMSLLLCLCTVLPLTFAHEDSPS